MATNSKAQRWGGWTASGVAVLFLVFDCVIKLAVLPQVTKAMDHLGYPPGMEFTIGVIETLCLVPYLIPRTSILGAVLMTGYLGGAVATHTRIGSPLATHILFPIYTAVLLWGGLYLRDERLRRLIPLRVA